MNTISITLGLILIAWSRISKWRRIATAKQKIFDGYTKEETKIQWIGLTFVFITIILSIILK